MKTSKNEKKTINKRVNRRATITRVIAFLCLGLTILSTLFGACMTAFAAEAPVKEKTELDYKDEIIAPKENCDPNFAIKPKTNNVDPEFSISLPSSPVKRFSDNFEVMPYRPYKIKPIDKDWNRGKIKEKGLKKKLKAKRPIIISSSEIPEQ